MGEMLTTRQAAKRAGVHIDTMRRWIREGVVNEKHVKRVGMRQFVDSDGIPPKRRRGKPDEFPETS